jgi:hypothetical protein
MCSSLLFFVLARRFLLCAISKETAWHSRRASNPSGIDISAAAKRSLALARVHARNGVKAMLLQREILVVVLTIAIAGALYLISFRDLMAVPPAPVGVAHGPF